MKQCKDSEPKYTYDQEIKMSGPVMTGDEETDEATLRIIAEHKEHLADPSSAKEKKDKEIRANNRRASRLLWAIDAGSDIPSIYRAAKKAIKATWDARGECPVAVRIEPGTNSKVRGQVTRKYYWKRAKERSEQRRDALRMEVNQYLLMLYYRIFRPKYLRKYKVSHRDIIGR